ncbi:hypothetical protein [Actinomadura rugatobispora]|uniref:Dihydroorotase n=1 Tax=Actinomadura rugatobispora TaxID=1994 RepID=A0ABW0ZW57_9ACTN|nr:hypothetical protein GCM10010200_111100 [Actinomadura rugatobispora]
MADTLIRGAPRDVLVRDGIVKAVGTGLPPGGADVVEATGQVLLPGLVTATFLRGRPTVLDGTLR